jgi:hypothetical protein
MSAPANVLEDALQPLRAMLAADGYALATSDGEGGRVVVLDVTATPDACAECLAPPAVIASVARSCLSDSALGPDIAIEVHVPDKDLADKRPGH